MILRLFFKYAKLNSNWTLRRISSTARWGIRNVLQVRLFRGHDKVLSDADKIRFENLFPQVVSCLTTHKDKGLAPVMKHLKTALEYNVPNGLKQRGYLTVAAYKSFTTDQTEEQLIKASIMGWCVEMMHTIVNMSDDIADGGLQRRGKQCWHLKDNIGLPLAINDILLFKNGIYKLLRNNFIKETYYLHVVDIFHEMFESAFSGQILDVLASKKYSNGDLFTSETLDVLDRTLSSSYSLYMPISVGMHMAGITGETAYNYVRESTNIIGTLFKVQNDYFGNIGEANKTGKTNNDIEEGKCTWPIVTALKLANEEDKMQLKSWYGNSDPKLVELVVSKYKELQLDKMYDKYESELIETTIQLISATPVTPTVPFEEIISFFKAMYKLTNF